MAKLIIELWCTGEVKALNDFDEALKEFISNYENDALPVITWTSNFTIPMEEQEPNHFH